MVNISLRVVINALVHWNPDLGKGKLVRMESVVQELGLNKIAVSTALSKSRRKEF